MAESSWWMLSFWEASWLLSLALALALVLPPQGFRLHSHRRSICPRLSLHCHCSPHRGILTLVFVVSF